MKRRARIPFCGLHALSLAHLGTLLRGQPGARNASAGQRTNPCCAAAVPPALCSAPGLLLHCPPAGHPGCTLRGGEGGSSGVPGTEKNTEDSAPGSTGADGMPETSTRGGRLTVEGEPMAHSTAAAAAATATTEELWAMVNAHAAELMGFLDGCEVRPRSQQQLVSRR